MKIFTKTVGIMRQHSLTISTNCSQLGFLHSSLTSQATSIKIKVLSSDKVLLNLIPTWSCQFKAYCSRILLRQTCPQLLTKISTPGITALIMVTAVLKWHHNKATTCRSVSSRKYCRTQLTASRSPSQKACLVSMRFRPQHYKTTRTRAEAILSSDLSLCLQIQASPKYGHVSCVLCEIYVPLKLIIRT
jgi:hypothetical protein